MPAILFAPDGSMVFGAKILQVSFNENIAFTTGA